jgi:hypothetical protein
LKTVVDEATVLRLTLELDNLGDEQGHLAIDLGLDRIFDAELGRSTIFSPNLRPTLEEAVSY